MRNLVNAFPKQLKEALEIANATDWNAAKNKIDNIVISGLGGSGIGGTIVSQLLAQQLDVPVYVNKDYSVPAFVNENTLFIASSYSGNTEETLEALAKAEAAGVEVACISSGGKLTQIATDKGYNLITLPGGYPPRAAFAFSCTMQFAVLTKYGLIGNSAMDELVATQIMLDEKRAELELRGKALAEKLYKKVPVIYSDARLEGIAVRFRQQINENSKMLCWHHVLPEMNHNELVGWAEQHPEAVAVFFRTGNDYYRTQERFEFSKQLMATKGAEIVEIQSDYDSDIMNAYTLIYIGDWASVYLAEMKEIDPVEVDVITGLKDMLAKI